MSFLALHPLAAITGEGIVIERVQFHMGTYARIISYGGTNEDVDLAFREIMDLDNMLSDYKPESQISRINKSAGQRAIKVSDGVIDVLTFAKQVSIETQGVFDPTIGALTIGVYRFGRVSKQVAINEENIRKARSLVNYRGIQINGNYVKLKKEGMMLDLGGIGKGFAVDKAVQVLKDRGISRGMVSLSGDMRVFGSGLEIGIKDPSGKGTIASFKTGTTNLAISTSGGYERSVDAGGRVYHHLIVPRTGKPGDDFLSITVLMSGNNTLADAYATSLYLMGWEKSKDFLSDHPEIGVFIVFPDRSIYHNQTFLGFSGKFEVVLIRLFL